MATTKIRKLAIIGGTTLLVGYGINKAYSYKHLEAASAVNRPHAPLPTRADHLKALQSGEPFDILVVGGGATGCGVALDSTVRGLRTALVEMDDFASGTSSRSTKLIHGGVRYLQKAILHLDYEQYRMVREALEERANMLEIAPHLASPLPIMLPIYRWWQVPYYWVGIKAYDLVAGKRQLESSFFLSKRKALEQFPMLKKDNLCGALVYYDGQQNDARMNLSLAITAARQGAAVVNHCKVLHLLKEPQVGQDGETKEKVSGARLRDEMTGQEWDVKARCVINATGPFTDSLRTMADPNTRPICQPSSGIHVVLPGYYSPASMGLLDPATSDGRVIFFLPWLKKTIAGTTDRPCEVTASPEPTEDEIQFILEEIRHYLTPDLEVRRGDVLSAWCGIRPLVLDPNKSQKTEAIARNHIIEVSPSGLVTIAGGKWTTYRSMAEETVDRAIAEFNLQPVHPKSLTRGFLVEGAHRWSPTMYIRLVQDFGLETDVAQHLASTYGDRAFSVAKMARLTGKRWPVVGRRLTEDFPYIEAEVRYAIKEYALSAVDVIARRIRLAFLNVEASVEALPTIVDIMAEELKWSSSQKKAEMEKAMDFIKREMGKEIATRVAPDVLPVGLTSKEVSEYTKRFTALDGGRKGYITINDLRNSLKSTGEKVSEQQLHEILNEVDLNRNGQIELQEFLILMASIKSGHIVSSRLAKAAEQHYQMISVERSGGGL